MDCRETTRCGLSWIARACVALWCVTPLPARCEEIIFIGPGGAVPDGFQIVIVSGLAHCFILLRSLSSPASRWETD